MSKHDQKRRARLDFLQQKDASELRILLKECREKPLMISGAYFALAMHPLFQVELPVLIGLLEEAIDEQEKHWATRFMEALFPRWYAPRKVDPEEVGVTPAKNPVSAKQMADEPPEQL